MLLCVTWYLYAFLWITANRFTSVYLTAEQDSEKLTRLRFDRHPIRSSPGSPGTHLSEFGQRLPWKPWTGTKRWGKNRQYRVMQFKPNDGWTKSMKNPKNSCEHSHIVMEKTLNWHLNPTWYQESLLKSYWHLNPTYQESLLKYWCVDITCLSCRQTFLTLFSRFTPILRAWVK